MRNTSLRGVPCIDSDSPACDSGDVFGWIPTGRMPLSIHLAEKVRSFSISNACAPKRKRVGTAELSRCHCGADGRQGGGVRDRQPSA